MTDFSIARRTEKFFEKTLQSISLCQLFNSLNDIEYEIIRSSVASDESAEITYLNGRNFPIGLISSTELRYKIHNHYIFNQFDNSYISSVNKFIEEMLELKIIKPSLYHKDSDGTLMESFASSRNPLKEFDDDNGAKIIYFYEIVKSKYDECLLKIEDLMTEECINFLMNNFEDNQIIDEIVFCRNPFSSLIVEKLIDLNILTENLIKVSKGIIGPVNYTLHINKCINYLSNNF